MFLYFGAKFRSAKRYPAPLHDTIVEPFAGAAGYSMNYHQRKVVLYDINPKVIGIWNYLIRTSSSEIMRLPAEVESVEDLHCCEEARWLISFYIAIGDGGKGRKKMTSWAKVWPDSHWGTMVRSVIARQVNLIRHWKAVHGSYREANIGPATYYVDPPYQKSCGDSYEFRRVDFKDLSKWCYSINGQLIVCEQLGSNWMPFKPLYKNPDGLNRRNVSHTTEVIYYRESQ